MKRYTFSEKVDLIEKSREAMLSAVQIYNNPLTTFKSESYIVLSMIAWTYLLQAFYRSKNIDYRYYTLKGRRKCYIKNPDGSIKYWDLKECISKSSSPLDCNTVNNLEFLIGLRNQIEHKKANGLDSYMSARYQACALNYNYYLKTLHGDKYSLDSSLALSLQFAELDFYQAKTIKNKEGVIPKKVFSYIADFDRNLSLKERRSDRFAYRLLFTKVTANRVGQADRVVEFVDPKSPLAKKISKQYWVMKERKSQIFFARQVLEGLKKQGISITNIDHIELWKKYDAKNPSKSFGVLVGNNWYWYQDWIDFLLKEFQK